MSSSTIYIERVVEVVRFTLKRKAGGGSDTFHISHDFWAAGTLYSGSPVVSPLLAESVSTPRSVDRQLGIRHEVTISLFGRSHFNGYGRTFFDLADTHELRGADVQVRRYLKTHDGLASHADDVNIRQVMQVTGFSWNGEVLNIDCRDTWFEDKELSRRLIPSMFTDLQEEFRYEYGAIVFGQGDARGVVVDAPCIEKSASGTAYSTLFLGWTFPNHPNESRVSMWAKNSDTETDNLEYIEVQMQADLSDPVYGGTLSDLGEAYPRHVSLYSRGVLFTPSQGQMLSTIFLNLRRPTGYWAADFNGSNNLYLEGANAYQFDDNSFTFAVWVNFDSTSGHRAIFGKGRINKTPDPDLEYWLFRHNSDVIRFGISGRGVDADLQVDAPVSTTTGVWYWIVCGYDKDNRQIFCQVNNGTVYTASAFYDGTITGAQRGDNSNPAYLQLDSGASSSNNFYNGWRLTILQAGSNQDKTKPVFTYTGSTRRAFFETNWSPQPANGDAYRLILAPWRRWRNVAKEGAFELGYIGHNSINHFDGAMCFLGCWKGVLGSSQRTFIYNSGNRRAYEELTDSEKINMVSWHDLKEFYGERRDSHSNKHLADAGSVGSRGGARIVSFASQKGQVRIKIARAVYKSQDDTWEPERLYRDYPIDAQALPAIFPTTPFAVPVDPPLPVSLNGRYFVAVENDNNTEHFQSLLANYDNVSGQVHYARINDQRGRAWVKQNNVQLSMSLHAAGDRFGGFVAEAGGYSTYTFGSYQGTIQVLSFVEPTKGNQYKMGIRGLLDDGSGTYTGSASASIRNFADVLRFALMNPDFGRGLTSDQVDTTSFNAARAWGNAHGVFLSFAVDREMWLSELVQKICEQTGAILYKTRQGRLRLRTPAWHWKRFNYSIDEGRMRDQLRIQSVDSNPGAPIYNDFVVNFGVDPLNVPKDPDFVFRAGSNSFSRSLQIDGSGSSFADAPRVAKLAASEALYGKLQFRLDFDLFGAEATNAVLKILRRIVDRYSSQPMRAVVRVPLKAFFAVDLFDTFMIRHTDLPLGDGTSKHFVWINPDDDDVEVEWYDDGIPISWVKLGRIEGEVVGITEYDQYAELTVETMSLFT